MLGLNGDLRGLTTVATRGTDDGLGGAGERNDRGRHRDVRSNDAAEGLVAGDEHPKPSEEKYVTGGVPAPRIDGAGREGRGRPAWPANTAVGRPRRTIVAGGGDHK